MKYYVVSDTHGFYSLLQAELQKAGYYDEQAPHKLLMLGDLFDRGREPKELQEFVLKLMDKDEIILIRGNHEDLFQEMVTEDEGLPYSHHVSNGTYITALQLTGYDPALARIRNGDFAEAAKQTQYYQTIMPAMLDYYETEHTVFTHGWIPCISEKNGQYSFYSSWRDADKVEWQRARWINGMDAARTASDDEKTVVCGHWHASYGHANFEKKGSEFGDDADISPYHGSGVIAIDACTAHSQRINVLVIDDEDLKNRGSDS